MTKVETLNGPVWVNPRHVVRFWDYTGTLCITLICGGELEAVGMTASQFARIIENDADGIHV